MSTIVLCDHEWTDDAGQHQCALEFGHPEPHDCGGCHECGARKAECVCTLPADGHAVHACSDSSVLTPSGRCHGQWRDDGTVVQWPTGAWTEDEAREHVALVMAGQPIPEPREVPA